MKWLFWRLAPEVLLSVAVVSAVGCSGPNQDVAPGPPVLQSFSVIDNLTGGSLDTSLDGGPVDITGFVHLSALFDRLLDPTTVANLDDGGTDVGANVTTVTFSPPLPATATFSANTIYTPNGGPIGLVFASGPSLTTNPNPTFPSGSTVTVTLDKNKVRSKKGEPFTGDGDLANGQIIFHTLPFAATIGVPEVEADAGADAGVMPAMQPVTITFNNLPKANIDTHVTVTAGGSAFTQVVVAADPANPTMYTVTPTGTWPANTLIEVTVDATAADALDITSGAAASASFMTSGS